MSQEDKALDKKLAALEKKFGAMYQDLFGLQPMKAAGKQHMMLLQEYPHRKSEVTPEGAELTPHD